MTPYTVFWWFSFCSALGAAAVLFFGMLAVFSGTARVAAHARGSYRRLL